MKFIIDFYAGVEDAILEMPANLQARILKLLELMETPRRTSCSTYGQRNV